jgi:hypothetical protein
MGEHMHLLKEKRRVQRTRVEKSAQIILSREPVILCVVTNLTNLGACLRLDSAGNIPTAFGLSLDNRRTIRSCEVVWRVNDHLGVTFT